MSSSETFHSRVLAGRYRTLRMIGAGSQGTVDLAEDLLHGGRHVAIKQLEGLLGASDPEPAAERLRWFAHPRWAEILDEGRFAEHSRFQVTRYVAGKSLDKLQLPLPEGEVWRFLEDGARVLGAIHEQGVIHYDVTPGNFLREESPAGVSFTLTDGGLASLGPVKGIARGTPRFMAPELLEGAPHDHRADLYALGLVAFLLAAGRDPLVGGAGEVLGRRRREDAPLLRSLAPSASETLEKVLALLLVKDPQARPADADAFLTKMAALRGATTTAISASDAASRASGGRVVGRDAEIARFREACRATVSRATVLVSVVPGGDTPPPPRPDPVLLVHGPAGSGGTRLMREFLSVARAEDLSVLALSGRGGAADRRSALRRIADSIVMLAGPGESSVLAPRRANREPRPDAAPAGAAAVDPRAIERFVDLCERVGQRTPLALLIEDFAELPAGTQEAIRVLSRHLLARAEHPDGRACPRVLLVVDLGPESPDALLIPDAENPKQPCLALAPLTPEDVKTLLRERFPGLEPAAKDLEAVHQASEGLPGILVRLLAEGLRRGDLRRDTGHWLWVTDRVSTYAVERSLSPQATAAFEALSPAARAAVEALALLDQPAPGPLLEALAGPEALRELNSSPLVAISAEARPPRYALRSHSVRQYALAQLSPLALASLRSELIQALGAIPAPDLAPELARFLFESGRTTDALAVLMEFSALTPIGSKSRAHPTFQAILLSNPSALDTTARRKAAACWITATPSGQALTLAIAQAFPSPLEQEDLPAAAECAERLAKDREFVASERLCVSHNPVTAVNPAAQARLLIVQARCALDRQSAQGVSSLLAGALRLLRAPPLASDPRSARISTANALLAASRYRFTQKRWNAALLSAQRALRTSRRAHSPLTTAFAYNNLAISLERTGDPEQAEWATSRSLRLKRALGDIAATIGTLHNLARIRYDRGALHEAGFLLSQAVAMGQRHAHHRATILALLSASDLYDIQGNAQLAIEALERVRTIAGRDASPVYQQIAVRRLSELQSALGRGTQAAASLAETTFAQNRRSLAPALRGEPTQAQVPLHLFGLPRAHDRISARRLTDSAHILSSELHRGATAFARRAVADVLRCLRGGAQDIDLSPFHADESRTWIRLSGRARRLLTSLLISALSRRTAHEHIEADRQLAQQLTVLARKQRWNAILGRSLAVECRLALIAGDRAGSVKLVTACAIAHDACDYAGSEECPSEASALLGELQPNTHVRDASECATNLHAAAHRLELGSADGGSNDRLATALRMILAFRARLQAGAGLDALLESLTTQAREITRAERACIVVVGENGTEQARITSSAAAGTHKVQLERVSQTVIRRAIASKQPLLLHDVFSDSELLAKPSIAAMALRSVLCVPMLRGKDLLGVMYADSSSGAGNFDRIDLEILGLFAEQAAAAIETGRLVADLQRSYSDLKAAQERLIRGERLRVMGEMTSGVAHEFNNLLTAILARLQLLNLGYVAPEVRSHLALIEKAALDAAGVIRRLQSFSRERRQQDYAVVDMTDVCGDVVELLRPLWSSRRRSGRNPISVHVRAPRGLTVFGDATELREVLTNLIKNSLEALDTGGTITVSGCLLETRVRIEVTDTGPGMSPELLGRVFDPFFTTKGERGTGLGLCLTQQIAERHGGEIRLESRVGAGTTATVELPYKDEQISEVTRVDGSPKSVNSVHVLVVDDDPDVRSPLCAYLEGSGHQVVGAGSGMEAMARVKEAVPDVVISDIGMPEMDGMEFCRRLRALNPNLPVILMSGTASAVEPSIVRDVGAAALLAKPFTMRQVMDLLETLTSRTAR